MKRLLPLLLLMLLLLCAGSLAAQSTPPPPTSPTTVSLPLAGGGLGGTYSIDLDTTGATVVEVDTAMEFTDALATADCDPNHYIIDLDNATTFTGNFTVADKSCASGKYIIIRANDLGACPTDGNRIDASYTGSIPRILSNASSPGLQIADSADNTIVRCVELDENIGTDYTNFIEVGDGVYTALNQVPANIILDQILIRGTDCMTPGSDECRRGISLNGTNAAVINSYIAEIHEEIFDSQAIASFCTQGLLLIDNNFAQASAENIFVGGGGPCGLPEPTVTSDITVTRNHLHKDLGWGADTWSVKNAFEAKGGKRALFQGNLIENTWKHTDHNQVHSIIIKAVNQDAGDVTWQEVSDWELSYNKCVNCEQTFLGLFSSPENCIEGMGCTALGFTGRALVKENLAFVGSADVPSFIYISNQYPHDGNLMEDIAILHNTFIPLATSPSMMGWTIHVQEGLTPLLGYAHHSNIMGEDATADINQDCFSFDVTAPPYTPITCTTSDEAYGNIVYNNTSGDCMDDFYGPNAASCPVANLAAVGFVNTGAGNYRLSPSSIGKGAGHDGLDVGLTAAGYEIMECLTEIAESGITQDCSTPSGASITGTTMTRGVTIR